MKTEELRLILLKRICEDKTKKQVAEEAGINASYLSQLFTGHKTLGEKAANNLESKLRLRPGVLVRPSLVDALEITPIASLFIDDHEASLASKGEDRESDRSLVVAARAKILLAVLGDSTKAQFSSTYKINPAYLSHLLSGERIMGERAARKLESQLGLKQGVLEHPLEVEIDSPEKIQALFLDSPPFISTRGRLLLDNLKSMLKLDLLSDDHVELLSSIAYQLSLPRAEAALERKHDLESTSN